ncbi:MAG: magnesium chelatase [Chloroflexota bacterium]
MVKRKSQLLEILYSSGPAAAVLRSAAKSSDRGLANNLRYPFLAIVGQTEMKLALIMALVNPAVGGVLLIGSRGTAKTTAVRGLLDLMPTVERSTCEYGCEPDDLVSFGMDGVCNDCAKKLGMGDSITKPEAMRLVELPLSTRLEDVVGGINERVALEQQRVLLDRGILVQSDQNVLYIDEVNLLENRIIDAILDAAAQGQYTVRRGPLAATYRTRLVLVGSMNPEEGALRPQIQDRFGLRVLIRGIQDTTQRLEVYHRSTMYKRKPYKFVQEWLGETEEAAWEISEARKRLTKVTFAPGVEEEGLRWIKTLKIDSHRAEMTLFEAGRAFAALDDRLEVNLEDLRSVAPLALRQRQTDFATKYFIAQDEEDQEIAKIIKRPKRRSRKKGETKKSVSPKKASSTNGKRSQATSEEIETLK